MTDHGNVFGAFDFYQQAKAAGIKPIIGIEAYVTPGTSRFDRTGCAGRTAARTTSPARGAYTHMTLLLGDHRGHAQPVPAGLAGSLEGFYLQAARGPRAAAPSTPRA